jgi:opacity protein-like surface antigen
MKQQMKSVLAGAVLALASSAALSAGVFQEFTVEEGSVAGQVANTIVADKLTGGYSELLTINADFTFDTSAFATFEGFLANDGTPPGIPAQLGSFNGYNMYALFYSSGQVTGANSFTGNTGSFELYIDPNQDSTFAFGATGADSIVVTDVSNDDYLIANASSLFFAVGIPGNPGAFELRFNDFALTTEGESYFTAPNPFHMVVTVDGDFDEFPITPGNIRVTGDVSAVFEVPEPGSLALVGLALAGLGFSARRKQQG